MGKAPRSVDELLVIHDEQLRGRAPARAPIGAVIEHDGRLVRTHYGTHGTIGHRPDALAGDVASDLIDRQQASFAARFEPVEWKVYAHDPGPSLAERLTAVGFTAGWERAVLVAELEAIPRPVHGAPGTGVRTLGYGDERLWDEVRRTAAVSGPHHTPLTELEADGLLPHRDFNVDVLRRDGAVLGAGWACLVDDSEFVAIGGMTGTHTELVPVWAAWARNRSGSSGGFGGRGAERRYLVAEADGALRDALLAIGFRQITTVRSFHWTPEGTPATTRPVRMLLLGPEYDDIHGRFDARFDLRPSISHYPGITEPPASVTWHVGSTTGTPAARHRPELDRIIHRGLRACARPGEQLYYDDPYHQGYRFDPRRVDGPGRPRWPGVAYREGDYALYLTSDLRLGTFGHPWEESLCVFGAELLAEVADELTDLLGTVMRRGGRNEGNVWTFDSRVVPTGHEP
ncbi:DUF2716 domain-containing protein [Streptomyces sp. NBC_01511]|uniref:DUF2716 domain-containing protein n=1 Tax=Streptomyces sp. NBC_01511 TaxID=2903889 RepID=UPI00386A2328